MESWSSTTSSAYGVDLGVKSTPVQSNKITDRGIFEKYIVALETPSQTESGVIKCPRESRILAIKETRLGEALVDISLPLYVVAVGAQLGLRQWFIFEYGPCEAKASR